jgi:biotin carboxyl carrier protein
MERKFKITVDGRQYSVTVEDLSDPGNAPHLEHSAFVTPTAPLTPSFAHGNSHSVPAAAPVARGPAEVGDVVSPLTGVVESVPVTIGQEIGEGDCVLVVEAMKMKTPVTAGWAGKVTAILVNVGDGVQTGQLLAKIA